MAKFLELFFVGFLVGESHIDLERDLVVEDSLLRRDCGGIVAVFVAGFLYIDNDISFGIFFDRSVDGISVSALKASGCGSVSSGDFGSEGVVLLESFVVDISLHKGEE